MQYFISFLEGIITFISPCLLPMLPIYIMYFAGGKSEVNLKKTVFNALGFILGFTTVFVVLGAFAGLAGSFMRNNQSFINIITGGIVVLFGLSYVGVIHIPFLKIGGSQKDIKLSTFFSSFLFGIVFSVSWTPCITVFLGSALMMASQKGSATQGIIMLLCYSLGLGIPFLISALLIDRLKGTFNFIKKHYKVVTTISGVFLIAVGIFMMTGLLGLFLSLFTI